MGCRWTYRVLISVYSHTSFINGTNLKCQFQSILCFQLSITALKWQVNNMFVVHSLLLLRSSSCRGRSRTPIPVVIILRVLLAASYLSAHCQSVYCHSSPLVLICSSVHILFFWENDDIYLYQPVSNVNCSCLMCINDYESLWVLVVDLCMSTNTFSFSLHQYTCISIHDSYWWYCLWIDG